MMGIDKTRAKMYNDCTCQGCTGFSLNSGSLASFTTANDCAQRAHDVNDPADLGRQQDSHIMGFLR